MTKRLVLTAFAGLILAGCQTFATSYGTGKVLTYGEGFRHGIEVTIPENAPSICSDFAATVNRGGGTNPHVGVDICTPVGYPVIAPADGIVEKVTQRRGEAAIEIVHWAPDVSVVVRSRFDHIQNVSVKEGTRVKRGQAIAKVNWNSGGRHHLHFMVKYPGWETDNPHKYWIGGPGKAVCFGEGSFEGKFPAMFTYPVPCVEPSKT